MVSTSMSEPSHPLRIAYVTTYDSCDVRSWSGSGFHIAQALENQGQTVLRIGPLTEHRSWMLRQKQRLERHLLRRFHPLDREPAVLDHYARQVREQLTELNADVVLSPGIIPLAHLKSGLPQVAWTDTTFAGVVDQYPEFSGLSPAAIRQGHASERAAFTHNALSIYTSRWAADSAISTYGADPAKVAVVPFGANSANPMALSAVDHHLAERLVGPLRLLFVGVDWRRKGGPQTLEILRHLRSSGCAARLTVIGCRPEIPDDLQSMVEVLGFIAKYDDAGRARLDAEFRRASFLVLLSDHECFGLVLCEACAQALPSLTTTADGIPTIIRDGINGLADPAGTSPQRLAQRLLDTIRNPDGYARLCRQALASYHAEFNWDVAGRQVMALLRTVVPAAS